MPRDRRNFHSLAKSGVRSCSETSKRLICNDIRIAGQGAWFLSLLTAFVLIHQGACRYCIPDASLTALVFSGLGEAP